MELAPYRCHGIRKIFASAFSHQPVFVYSKTPSDENLNKIATWLTNQMTRSILPPFAISKTLALSQTHVLATSI